MNNILNWGVNLILTIFTFITLWFFCQVFLLTSFRIPSDSMEPELVEGDFVAVWKPTLGARLFNLNATLRLEQTAIHRVPGFRRVRRGDVLVFNFPHPNGWDKIEMHILKYYIKRCIGLPGDTLSIRDGRFRINGVSEPLGNLDSQEPDRANATGRIRRWHLQGIPVRLRCRLEYPGFRTALYS